MKNKKYYQEHPYFDATREELIDQYDKYVQTIVDLLSVQTYANEELFKLCKMTTDPKLKNKLDNLRQVLDERIDKALWGNKL